MGKSTVAVARATPETILEDIDRVCRLAHIEQALERGVPTVLKDDIAWRYPFPAANTTPWQLEGSILALRSRGFEPLSLVQSKVLANKPVRGEELKYYLPLCEKYDIPVLYTFKRRDMRWVEYRPKAPLLVLHQLFDTGIVLPDYLFGKNVVHLPTVKCHRHTTTAGAMLNALNGSLGAKRYYTRSVVHRTLVDLLAIQREILGGLFAIMDGTTAGNGPGPKTLTPVTKNIILASGDQVAIDAVAAKLMGFDPMSIEYIQLAHRAGLGVGDPRDIAIVGADISDERWGFSAGAGAADPVNESWGRGQLNRAAQLFLRTPLADVLATGNEIYDDKYRWGRQQRATFEEWRRTTPWGQLFEAYALGQSDRIVKSG